MDGWETMDPKPRPLRFFCAIARSSFAWAWHTQKCEPGRAPRSNLFERVAAKHLPRDTIEWMGGKQWTRNRDPFVSSAQSHAQASLGRGTHRNVSRGGRRAQTCLSVLRPSACRETR